MDRTRQTTILNPDNITVPVHIIGVGATGGWVALSLAKMGIKDIRLYDFDTVDEHNIPNQIYRTCDIGKSKALACKEIINQSTDDTQEISAFDIKLTGENIREYITDGYILCFVDSIAVRKEIFDNIVYKPDILCFIETRIGTDCFRVYMIDPSMVSHNEGYIETLPEEENTEESFCGTRQTIIGTAMMAASAAVWKFIEVANTSLRNYSSITNEIISDVKEFQTLSKQF